jgi:hypothetical protein
MRRFGARPRGVSSGACHPLRRASDAVRTATDGCADRRGEIVILGEVHDNPAHHVLQDAVIAAVAPTAIVFEMITAEEAALVTPDLAAEADALSDALDWATSGWPDFAMYAPLFAHAVRAAIYGAEVPRDAAQEAFATGAAAVFRGRCGAVRPDRSAGSRGAGPSGGGTAGGPLQRAAQRRSFPVSSRRSACATRRWPRPR